MSLLAQSQKGSTIVTRGQRSALTYVAPDGATRNLSWTQKLLLHGHVGACLYIWRARKMLRVTLWHEPEGFQFFVRDPDEHELRRSSQVVVDEMRAKGFSARDRGVAVRTISEFSMVPIQVEYDVDGFPEEPASDWDHVIECSLQTSSGKFVFEGCSDPEPFGVLDLPKGSYRVRIHFGGQQSGQADGSSEDFYLFRVWRGRGATRILKGDESWPRPMQLWESPRHGKQGSE